MGINIRAKGANGERDVANALNGVIQLCLKEQGFPQAVIDKAASAVQRNQNQSAVGGNDLTNTFGLSIEIKRQEQLSINTWWNQCTAAAERNKEWPVLLYRQNHGKWQCVTYVRTIHEDRSAAVTVRATMDWDAFIYWFKSWVDDRLRKGYQVQI
jgi:hypothetical protein